MMQLHKMNVTEKKFVHYMKIRDSVKNQPKSFQNDNKYVKIKFVATLLKFKFLYYLYAIT